MFVFVFRLRIQLLCSWTECVRKTKRLLSESLLTNCKKLAREWVSLNRKKNTYPCLCIVYIARLQTLFILFVCYLLNINHSRQLPYTYLQKPPTENGPSLAKDRVARRVRRILDCATRAPHCDYNKLHSCLFSLERELNSYNVNGAGQ